MKMNQSLLSLDWNLLFTIVTVLVLFIILKHFFFEKVHKVMEDREKYVNDTISNAEEKDRQAEEKLALYNAQLATAEDEGRKIIKNARDEAKSQAKEIIDEADEKARALMEHSQKEIRREKYNARKELREEVSGLAVLAASRIIEKEITDADQQDIINKVLEEAEDKPWS